MAQQRFKLRLVTIEKKYKFRDRTRENIVEKNCLLKTPIQDTSAMWETEILAEIENWLKKKNSNNRNLEEKSHILLNQGPLC